MKLTTLHKITIGCAIAGTLAFAGWSSAAFYETGASVHLWFAVGGGVVATGFSLYLRNFSRKHPQSRSGPRDGSPVTDEHGAGRKP